MRLTTYIGELLAVCLVFVMVHIFVADAGAAGIGPLDQVRGMVDNILTIMKDDKLSAPGKKDERRDTIMVEVEKRFDFREMSKRTLARNWKSRSEPERKEFQELFSELLKHTYIGRVEAYSNEQVIYPKVVLDKKKKNKAMVYSKVLKNNQEIPINYRLYKKNGEWFVYDVVIEGVSLVRNYRTEFGRVISKEKYPGLISKIKEKIEKNEASRRKS